jgi:hypothetical protein
MNHTKLKNSLEVITNLSILSLTLIIIMLLLRNYLAQPLPPQLKSGLQKGSKFYRLPGVDYGASRRTLLVALSANCEVCSESLSFFEQLKELRGANATRIIGIFPENESEVRRYVDEKNLRLEVLAGIDLKAFSIAGTPTAVMVDSDAIILDFWTGIPSEEIRNQITQALSRSGT